MSRIGDPDPALVPPISLAEATVSVSLSDEDGARAMVDGFAAVIDESSAIAAARDLAQRQID